MTCNNCGHDAHEGRRCEDCWMLPVECQSDVTVIVCPDPSTCKCNCPTSCEHEWDGPEHEEKMDRGYLTSATCSKCGMLAFDHDIRVGP